MCNYTKYLSSEEGFYNWHEDITWCNDNMFQRKLSFSVQLSDSDDYEGGDLIFDLPPELCPPKETVRKQGTIIIFPSFVRHMVTPSDRRRKTCHGKLDRRFKFPISND